MKKRVNKLIAMDLDGVLCEGEAWSIEDVMSAKPIQKNIDKCKRLIQAGHIIFIYTARNEELMDATKLWLRRHGVWYHAISNNKLPADIYVDDKAIRPAELKLI